jgi:hypothetical protein
VVLDVVADSTFTPVSRRPPFVAVTVPLSVSDAGAGVGVGDG